MEPSFRILRVHHIGLVPRDAGACQDFLTRLLGLGAHAPEVVESQRITCTQVEAGETLLELLSPTSPDSPIAKFLTERKGGIHHIALEVDDIHRAVTQLRAQGVMFLSDAPGPGSHHTQVIFIHPKSTGGILIELVSL
jgi:methylmalonyl-CoA/ethylmalonyl-CoA epimerase